MYAYCGNNPVNFVDYMGKWAAWNSFWNNVLEVADAFVETIISSVELEVGFGFGVGFDLFNNISVGVCRDTYVGMDDSESITGNKFSGKVAVFDSKLSFGSSYNYRAEQGGNRVSKEIPDNNFAIGPFLLNGENEVLFSFSDGVHFGIGGQVSVAFNITEFVRRIFIW